MEEKNKKKKIIIISLIALLVIIAVILFFWYRSKITATTMRIIRIEGDVNLEDGGDARPARADIRLASGNALSTAIKSLVSIGLDDVKIVTLDEQSRAEFSQSGRQLDLHLTAGSLFFEVQKPLEDDETMEIRTNTMIVGIRGTSGWVSVEGEHESVIVSDGHVHVIGINPTTGEKKEIEVYAGQKVSTYLFNDRTVDSIEFFLEDVTEHELEEFMLERLRENRPLVDKVCDETEWDKPWILGLTEDETTPTPAPDETEGDGDDNDSESEDEATPSPTPTATPTPSPTPVGGTGNKADEDAKALAALQEELAKMLALMTPTPTPIPWWMYPQENNTSEEDPYGEEEEEDDDDDDDDDKSTPTPTPTSAPVTTATLDNSSPPRVILSNGTDIGYWNGTSLVIENESVTLPIKLTGNGVNTTLSKFTQIGWNDCIGNSLKIENAAGDYVIFDGGGTYNYIYNLYDSAGNTLYYTDYPADFITELNNRGL